MRNLVACLIFIPVMLFAQSPQTKPDWSSWRFLLGEWIGTGGGDPGQGTGSFTFALDLQDRVITRRNIAEYPAGKDKAAYRHEDLMVIYQRPDKQARADYYDSEGHVIHYSVEMSKGGRSAVFLSDSLPAQPRYRLTYFRMGDAEVAISFDIATSGSAEFKQYIQASAHKK